MTLRHLALLAMTGLLPLAAPARQTENFDAGWRFLRAVATGAEQNRFDDSAWRKINLPHDWSIAGPFSKKTRPAARARSCPAASAGIANIFRRRNRIRTNPSPSSSTA